MSYTLYQTKAIVIAVENRGEANRFVTLLTEEYGLIKAMVQSVREIRSKQRFGLQLFSCSNVNLIKGKDMWRIAGVEPDVNFGLRLSDQEGIYGAMARIGRLMIRLVQGEEANVELFIEFHRALQFLSEQSLDEETIQYFETLLILRVLYHLGYWPNNQEAPWLVDADLSQEILEQTALNHDNLIERVNASLRETQL